VFECYPQKLNSDHVLIIGVLGMLLCEADVICVSGNLIVSLCNKSYQSLCNFSSFNFFKIQPANKDQSLISKMACLILHQ
jgi:hypothetical protein